MSLTNEQVVAADRGEEAKRDRKHSHFVSNDDVDRLSPIGPGVRGIEEGISGLPRVSTSSPTLSFCQQIAHGLLRLLHVSQHSM